ncbi:MAG: FHA domain-containing protein, partial [Lachnospiraceae bacterium]|nr:FHA domain-containing protein [Lachnospiraceae bacterium]
FENKKAKKEKEQEKREEYRDVMDKMMGGYAVAEESGYEEGYGRTTFITQRPGNKEGIHRLYFADGRKASELDTPNLLIGKYKDKVDLFLDDPSVSRMHARILKDQDQYFVEDANSTNGTFCNSDRLQPYEKKKLETGDELRFGNAILFFR